MNDTPDHIQRLYSDFIMSKSVTERFRMGFDMINDGRRMIEQSIARQYPGWSEAERKAAVFERIYRDDFSADDMAKIKASIIAFHSMPV